MIDFRTPNRRILPDRQVNSDRRIADRRQQQENELKRQSTPFKIELDGPLITTDGEPTE
jgi:hypothetical protein